MNSLKDRITELEKENTILRGMCAKIMPCHYCGVDEIAKCLSGFPGCSLADDLLFAQDEEFKRVLTKLSKLIHAAEKIVAPLVVVGNDTNWADGDETDRVYPWYEIKPLADLIAEIKK